jgi:serine/threonine protein kinase
MDFAMSAIVNLLFALLLLPSYASFGAHAFVTSFTGSSIAAVSFSSSSTLSMAVPIIDDWKILKSGQVVGKVRNHPVIDDGDTIRTSPLDNPQAAAPRLIVQTTSGSKYKLGKPSIAQERANAEANGKVISPSAAPSKVSAAVKTPLASQEKDLKKALLEAKREFDLTGQKVGNDKYLISGKPRRSTSQRSQIFKCYESDGDGLPVGSPLCVKISQYVDTLSREATNYQRVTSGLTRGQFVRFVDFFKRAGSEKTFSNQGAIVLERGELDLKSYLEQYGPLQGKELRDAAVAGVQCLQAVHSAGLVWTDLKAENFVVMDLNARTIKGIDLESAIPLRGNPVDYSPEACPPEFAEALMNGDGPYFNLQFNYDIWSLGMLLYDMSTGTNIFSGKPATQIMKMLNDPNFEPDTSAVPDDKLRDLINSCLQVDPKMRPTLPQVLLHPYFLTTGIGPFSF